MFFHGLCALLLCQFEVCMYVKLGITTNVKCCINNIYMYIYRVSMKFGHKGFV